MTGEDLGLKPSTVEQTKFEYSPFGKVFTKRLKEEDKKQELFKRLKKYWRSWKKTIGYRLKIIKVNQLF